MPTIKGSTHRHILLQMNVLVRDGKVVDRNTLESDTLQNLRAREALQHCDYDRAHGGAF